MITYQVSIYGQVKGNVIANSAHSAMLRASFIWFNGNTRGISVLAL